MTTQELPVSKSLTVLLAKRNGNFPQVNSILINSEKNGIIDPGYGHKEYFLKVKNNIDLLLFTHSHPEHFSYGHLFNCQKYAHHNDASLFSSTEKLASKYGFPSDEIKTQWINFFKLTTDMATTDITNPVDDGEMICFGDINLQVIHTPGHTEGHCCFFEPKNKILLSGDFDLVPQGPWFGHAMSDINKWYNSIDKLLAMDIKIIIPSHSKPIFEDAQKILHQYKNISLNREEKLIEFLKQKRNITRIFAFAMKMFYSDKLPTPPLLWEWFGQMTITQHLQRLIKNGKIRILGEYFIS